MEDELGIAIGPDAGTGSRVAWGLGLTMARCWPTSALRRLDLPTLGAPARAMWPVRGMGEDSRNSTSLRKMPRKAVEMRMSTQAIDVFTSTSLH